MPTNTDLVQEGLQDRRKIGNAVHGEESDNEHSIQDELPWDEQLHIEICCMVADNLSLPMSTSVPSRLMGGIWDDGTVGDACHKVMRPSLLSPEVATQQLLREFWNEMHERTRDLIDGDFVCFKATTACGERKMSGLGPSCMDSGDVIFAMKGVDIPHILRRTDGGRWLLVGQAYLFGAMDGEMVSDDTEWQELIIV